MANIIFDFDGTIADSLEVVGDIFYEMTQHRELKKPEIAKIRQLPLRQIAKQLHVRWWQIPILVIRGRKLMSVKTDEISIFKGIAGVIKQLKAKNNKLLIMSSNSSITVRSILRRENLENYFSKIYGGIGLFSKAQMLQRIIWSNRLNRKTCYYIGDEERDIEASRRVNIHCIAVAWGFSDTSRLRELHPYALALQPKDIISIINQNR
jgi:phosphoglycolate phosphatase